MKKLFFAFSLFFSVLAVAQQIDKPYDFPVKPATAEWAKLNTSKEMDEVCVIPVKDLSNLSTKALLFTCLNYPRIIDFYLFNNLQTGFDICSIRFNGLSELLERTDLNQVLLEIYPVMDIQNKTIVGYDGKLSHLQIGFFELLISQKRIIDQFNKEDKRILLSKTGINLEKRKEIGQSYFRQLTSALILTRILYSESINPTEKDMNGYDLFDVFNTDAVILDTSIIDKLLNVAKGIK